jgi:hypothetical protein
MREKLGVNKTIIFKSIFKTWDGEAGTKLMWLRIETDSGRL